MPPSRLGLPLLLCVLASAAGKGAAAAQNVTPDAATATVDWPGYNNDAASDRYVALAAIDRTNVKGLHVICTAPLGAVQTVETGPIVVAGVLYATTKTQTIAIDAATCRQRWTNTYVSSVSDTSRGAAFGNGLVFRGYPDGHVLAINAASGTTVWNERVIAAASHEEITAAPITWGSLLIIGTSNGDDGAPCHVLALDQKTGRLVWSQQTVPNVGSAGASTWKGATHIGGGAAWTSFTIDPATAKLYVPAGNPAPDYDVRARLGANVFTNSILEFNSATGAASRALQLIAQDDHDWDQAATPAIVTLANRTKIALAAGKDGLLHSIDLATFKQRWQTPVTTILNAAAPIVTSGTHFCPGGGVLWNGPAYSPATGFAYVNAVDWCRTVYLEPKPVAYVPGKPWLGSSNVVRDAAHSGWLRAVNATTGAPVWAYHSTAPLVAGVTPTSGGLVFTADLLGNVLAFDAGSGALLRTVATGLPAGGGVLSYAVAGKQFVAVAAGMTSFEFLTPSTKPAIVILGL